MSITKLNRHATIAPQYQLKRILKSKIEDGQYQPGDKLQSEMNLAKTYGVSRHVVRQSMKALINEGCIYHHQGKGYFVNHPPVRKTISQLSSHTEIMANIGRRTYTLTTAKQTIDPPDFIGEILLIGEKEKAIYLERITFLEDEPACMIIGYYPEKFAPILLENNIDNQSIYEKLRKIYNICPSKAKTIVSVRFAEQYQSEMLQIHEGSPLIHIGSFTWSTDDTIFEYSVGFYRSDRFKLEIEQTA